MAKKAKTSKKPQRVWRRVAPAPTQIHELKITLRDSKPPIWRRVAVPSDMTLGDLHDVIQVVMGWTNSHLHQFVVPRASPPKELRSLGFGRHMRNDRFISDPRFELDDTEDEYAVTLNDVAPAAKSKFEYQYDFGDSWDHTIQVVKVSPPVEGVRYPLCLAGKLACPPDDCGGIYGYYGMLEAVQDPDHEDHEHLKEWLGGDFDPEHFDIEEVNKTLASLR